MISDLSTAPSQGGKSHLLEVGYRTWCWSLQPYHTCTSFLQLPVRLMPIETSTLLYSLYIHMHIYVDVIHFTLNVCVAAKSVYKGHAKCEVGNIYCC